MLILKCQKQCKKSWNRETLTLSMCAFNSIMSKYREFLFWSISRHIPFFQPLCGDDPEQNAGTIHASNSEHLPVFKAPRGDDPEHIAGTIHVSNPEHLLVFKVLRGDNPREINIIERGQPTIRTLQLYD